MTDAEKTKIEKIRAAYKLAKKNKGEDRLTQSDIKDAKEALYGKPKKDADYGAIKDYGELSKGGQIKPVKAVLGVAVLATKKGRDTLKKFFKGKKEIASSAPGMAAVPRTMNKGGGMDMGAKPRPRGNPGVVETVVGKGGDYIKDLIN